MVSNHLKYFPVILFLLPQILQSTLAQDVEFGRLYTFETIGEGYELSFEATDDFVTFLAIVETTGYVGFGISPSGNMIGADIFIAGVNDSTQGPYFGDYYSEGPGTPTRDTVHNWNLNDATQNATHTALNFSRFFDTGDNAHDIVIEEGDITVIWSVGSTDTISYHGARRGHAHLTIREGDVYTTESVSPTTTDSPYECTATKPCPTDMYCDIVFGMCSCIDEVYTVREYDSEFPPTCSRAAGASCILNPVDIDFRPCVYGTSCVAQNATHGRCQCPLGFVREELGYCRAGYGTVCEWGRTLCSDKLFLTCHNERCVCASPTLEYEFGTGKGCVAPEGIPCNIKRKNPLSSQPSQAMVQCAEGLDCVETSPDSGDYLCQGPRNEGDQ